MGSPPTITHVTTARRAKFGYDCFIFFWISWKFRQISVGLCVIVVSVKLFSVPNGMGAESSLGCQLYVPISVTSGKWSMTLFNLGFSLSLIWNMNKGNNEVKIFSSLLARCEGIPLKGPVMPSSDILLFNKLLSKQLSYRWVETPWHPCDNA